MRSSYGPANEMLTRGTMSFSYDLRGNQTEKLFKSGHRQVFGYSAAGRLASVAAGHDRARGRDAKLREVERYVYSPSAERVLVEEVSGKKLRHAHWDGPRAIEEFHEIGHGPGKKEKGELFLRDLGGQLLETAKFTRRIGRSKHECEDDDWDEWNDDEDRRGSGSGTRKLSHVRFSHGDFLGSTALVTNHRGRVLDRLSYGPWGETLEGNYARVKWGFTGHRWEAATGHWSAMHRQLDPRAGRWTQRDPLGAVDGENRYAYVAAAPLTYTDPSGLVKFSGKFPWEERRLNRILNDLKTKFASNEALCEEVDAGCRKKCKVCPTVNYKALLDDPNIVVTYDPNLRALGHTSGNSIRVGEEAFEFEETFKENLIHELTHVGAGPDHGTEALRWVHFYYNSHRGYTGWGGLSACDEAPAGK